MILKMTTNESAQPQIQVAKIADADQLGMIAFMDTILSEKTTFFMNLKPVVSVDCQQR